MNKGNLALEKLSNYPWQFEWFSKWRVIKWNHWKILFKHQNRKQMRMTSYMWFYSDFTFKIHYFLRFTRVITSFSCTQFLRKLAPTLHTRIYWRQAKIMSKGKLAAWVQWPVIILAKPKKKFIFRSLHLNQ